jgi:hypothetical protein
VAIERCRRLQHLRDSGAGVSPMIPQPLGTLPPGIIAPPTDCGDCELSGLEVLYSSWLVFGGTISMFVGFGILSVHPASD